MKAKKKAAKKAMRRAAPRKLEVKRPLEKNGTIYGGPLRRPAKKAARRK